MKKLFVAALAALTLTSCARLPQPARTFISTHFAYTSIREVEKEWDTNSYSVELRDNTDLEFTEAGDWIKVEA